MAKSRSLVGPFVILVVVAALGYGGWYIWDKKSSKEPEYSTIKVTRGNIIQTISATGNLQTTSQVTISSQVSGNVIAINADFNDHVTKGQWLLKIDPSTYEQKLKQAKADLDAAQAQAQKTREDRARTKDLFEKNLLSKADDDTAIATLAQAESTLVSREAAYVNAQTDLDRCTIYSPIEGVVLNRTTDVGGTVNVNQSAVALYTLINDLTKLQISADVSEADIGSVQEGQLVRFSVDAYLNRPFQGNVSQVRNFAKNTSGVVTFSVIIDVDNSNLLLKPGMTATANIIIAERPNVLMIANTALRVRIPPEIQEKMNKSTPGAVVAAAPTPPPADDSQNQQNQQDQNGRRNGRNGNGNGGGRGGNGGGRGGRNGGGSGQTTGVGMNVSNQPRTLYKLVTDASGKKLPEAVVAHLGISDGTFTQVVDGVAEGDTLITYVTMPGAAVTPVSGPPGQSGNPFQQRGGGFGGGGFGGRGGF
ncbi:MAG TPA: efflux RND transporter periplasmic adaptor subunit [Opitutaceae bacterium]|nr:efflux RND transporter periplasmic adaptor subunit [Opitutaceae bacterium]